MSFRLFVFTYLRHLEQPLAHSSVSCYQRLYSPASNTSSRTYVPPLGSGYGPAWTAEPGRLAGLAGPRVILVAVLSCIPRLRFLGCHLIHGQIVHTHANASKCIRVAQRVACRKGKIHLIWDYGVLAEIKPLFFSVLVFFYEGKPQ